MGKQRVVRRRRIYRAGLLKLFFFLALLPIISGGAGLWADDEQELEVRVETSPANPVVNSPWSVYILVNHPNPQEVSVRPPIFPLSLSLERVRTEARSVEGERWTRVDFLFTPQRPGALTVPPFEVYVSGLQFKTDSFVARFREEPGARRYDPRFRWVTPVSPVRFGEQGELFLELSNWDPLKNAPKGFLLGRAPRNAIIEEISLTEERGILLFNVRLIPLEASEFVLEAFSFQAEGYTLAVPGIRVPVLPPVEAPIPDQAVEEPLELQSPQAIAYILTSANPESVFPLFRGEYRRISEKVQKLWEENRRAEALAEIRRNERDSHLGPYLVPLRKEMEQALPLGFTIDETWRPLKVSLFSWALIWFLILFAPLILLVVRPRPGNDRDKAPPSGAFPGKATGDNIQKGGVTSRHSGGFKIVIALLFSIAVAVIFLEEGLGVFLSSRLNSSGNAAVLKETPGYRVPDTNGTVNIRFNEGQPVMVSDFSLDWCYAETTDGGFGWVPREAVILY